MSFEDASRRWDAVGSVTQQALIEARLLAHWGAQAVAAFGAAMVPARPDDSHASMAWIEAEDWLEGERSPGGWRAALRPAGLTLTLIGPDDRTETLQLAERRLGEATTWLTALVAVPGEEARYLELPSYDLPDHPVSAGEPFEAPDPDAGRELSFWLGNAARLLEAVREQHAGASPVRCWPHHFDIATLITLDPEEPNPEKARSIGVGLSPGDASYVEPYFYVNPWPRPAGQAGPALEGRGVWHGEGWFGAVLPASRLAAHPAGEEQASQVEAFLISAIAAAHALLPEPT